MTVQVKPIVTPQAHASAEAPHRSDAENADQIREHHAAMVAELDRLTARLRDAAPAEQETARRNLEEWFETVLVPHADKEKATKCGRRTERGQALPAGGVPSITYRRCEFAPFNLRRPGGHRCRDR